MNNKLIILESDDVVLFTKDAFKVSRLRELAIHEIRNKLNNHIWNPLTQKPSQPLLEFFPEISVGEEKIQISEFQYNFVINCQVLKIGGKCWQKGTLKTQICISPQDHQKDKVSLEFCPDEPDEPESPLDDIRKQIQAM